MSGLFIEAAPSAQPTQPSAVQLQLGIGNGTFRHSPVYFVPQPSAESSQPATVTNGSQPHLDKLLALAA